MIINSYRYASEETPVGGNDQDTVLLIPFDGSDEATSAQDTAIGGSSRSVSFVGTAQIDTAQSKFGGSSILLDGNSDGLSLADNADWTMGSGNWTVDFWMRSPDVTPAAFTTLFQQRASSQIEWGLHLNTDGSLRFKAGNSIPYFTDFSTGTGILSNDTWHHIAVVRNGTAFNIYVDGTSQGSDTDATSMNDLSALFTIGYENHSGGRYWFNGWIDEFRVSKGIARWTTNFTPPTSAYSLDDGNDEYTVLLLPFEGTDGDTNTTDTSLVGNDHVITFSGNAQLDTAQKKFGTASLMLDGTGDYVSTPDSADWVLGGGTGDFTIDCWVRPNSVSKDVCICNQTVDSSHGWTFYWKQTTGKLRFYDYNGAYVIGISCDWSPSTATWYHVALVRKGLATNDSILFIDGVAQTTSLDAGLWNGTITNYAAALHIGRNGVTAGNIYTDGWIDEFRISNVARWTTTFTPPTGPYTE